MFHIHNRRDSFRDNYTGLYNNPILSIVLTYHLLSELKYIVPILIDTTYICHQFGGSTQPYLQERSKLHMAHQWLQITHGHSLQLLPIINL